MLFSSLLVQTHEHAPAEVPASHPTTSSGCWAMIYKGTYLLVTDNSGAREVQCINTGKLPFARLGDLITVAVKAVGQDRKVRQPFTITPRHTPLAQVEKGTVQKAVVVETKKEVQRPDGSTVKFDRNTCVLVNAKLQPIGTRIFGFVTHELRKKQLLKILSLTTRVL